MDHKCIVCSSDTGRTSALCDKCINPQNAQEREHLFSSIFKVFQATAKTDFGSLETTCKSLADSISKIELGFTPTTVFDKDKHWHILIRLPKVICKINLDLIHLYQLLLSPMATVCTIQSNV